MNTLIDISLSIVIFGVVFFSFCFIMHYIEERKERKKRALNYMISLCIIAIDSIKRSYCCGALNADDCEEAVDKIVNNTKDAVELTLGKDYVLICVEKLTEYARIACEYFNNGPIL